MVLNCLVKISFAGILFFCRRIFQWSDVVVKTVVRNWTSAIGTFEKTAHIVLTPTVLVSFFRLSIPILNLSKSLSMKWMLSYMVPLMIVAFAVLPHLLSTPLRYFPIFKRITEDPRLLLISIQEVNHFIRFF